MNHPYYLGPYFESINSGSSKSQTWFDRGLIWVYGFDLATAYRCFKQAAELDHNYAMAHWGLAYSSGFYYNMPWSRMQKAELANNLQRSFNHSREALSKIAYASPKEAMLIHAMQLRCQSDSPVDNAEFDRWNDEYSDEMRKVYQTYPDDDDVCTLFADALMTRTPWALWDLSSGNPSKGASTVEAIEVLEKAIARREQSGSIPHPGLLHFYIHSIEMSKFPEKALRAADQLRELVPDVGHLCHMPSHIDVRCGNYYDAIVANDRAIKADRIYVENEGNMTSQTLSRIHNFHLKVYAAMFLGQYSTALNAAEQMIKTVPEDLIRMETPSVMADWIEGYISVKTHVYIRFGRWQEIVDHPLPQDPSLYRMTTAIWHYAKGIAHAVRGEFEDAKSEQNKFHETAKKVPESRYIFFNSCQNILKIAAQMLKGELEYRMGNYDTAFECLKKAVYLDDNLNYDEPWGWMQPPRHALGALLLEQGRIEEAKQIYMDDLGLSDTLVSTSHHIENLWSLHGLVECLERQGESQQAKMFRSRLNLAMARADVPINASCACRIEHYCCDR